MALGFGSIFRPLETTGLCECVPTKWTYVKQSGCVRCMCACFFSLVRLACSLTALGGAPALAG